MADIHTPKKKKRKLIPPVMSDVILALLPLAFIAFWAYGMRSVVIIASTVLAAAVAELLFSFVILKKKDTFRDGSALVTGLLLAFTLSPLTPWYVAVFGGATAVLFGKIMWGGMGRNMFNPALAGREFMSAFFASVMTGPEIWRVRGHVSHGSYDLFDGIALPSLSDYLDKLVYNPAGALGEYSALALIAGGLFLIVRRRISWHIPVAILLTFFALVWLFPGGEEVRYSVGGLLLGIIFMATDLPTSPSHPSAKLYYGIMIGLVVFVLILGGINFAYMSYGILILNGFTKKINEIFRPASWNALAPIKKAERIASVTLQILCVSLAVLSLHAFGHVEYLVYLYLIFIVLKYILSRNAKIANPI